MRRLPHFSELVGAVMALIALLVLAYAAVAQDSADARGALVLVLGAAVSFFLRGKVERPAP